MCDCIRVRIQCAACVHVSMCWCAIFNPLGYTPPLDHFLCTKPISLASCGRLQALITTDADLDSRCTSFATFPVGPGHSIQAWDAISPIVARQPVPTGQPCTPTQRERHPGQGARHVGHRVRRGHGGLGTFRHFN